MSEVPAEFRRAVVDAVAAAAVGDADAAASAVAEIASGGPAHVHAALVAWAAPVLEINDDGRTGPWMIETTKADGEQISLQDSQLDPCHQDALRIVACAGNGDHATIAAIVQTYWNQGPGPLCKLLASSVKLSAVMAKRLS